MEGPPQLDLLFSQEYSMGIPKRVSEGISTFTKLVNLETETVLTKLGEASSM
jgi:hypothetical protein